MITVLSAIFYSGHDFRWIRDVFMTSTKGQSKMGWRFDMEKEEGFRLMMHERDFKAGTTIRSNIIHAIEHSRRMIVILSR